ncbi:LysR family transcriptional regulator [Pseudohalioglobus sediminis]|uniref:LysR family transcriptional regulator n=1 Tax=Pseudohalioglobus sediminis TaxID=2606449 RepID=A0A5B0WQD9_9GAMM|nr:LysR family transcriptional regulator [Pseudohalioglobus sediminis]KAA1188391.1 LysR family transcriptional regulator [Pseudohalioglobus sediminis]
MDWDDIKVLLALARKGSARGAAQVLGVSNSTVTRRLDELEHSLQAHLFDRTPDGYRMTAAAEQLLPTAEHVEELILAAERRIHGDDQHLQGPIRLTLPSSDGMGSLIARLGRFAGQYPGIDLEISASPEALDLSRREADIAVRVMPAGGKPPDYLIGRRMSALSASAYVHRDLLKPEAPEDVSHLVWIGKEPAGQKADWLDMTDFPDHPRRHAIADLSLVVAAVRAKMGMAFMPCLFANEHEELVRVPGASVVHHSDLWVLTHKDLRLSARLRVLREVIAEEFDRLRPQLDSRAT